MDFMSKEQNETVLAVSHGAACRQFMRYWAHTSDVDQQGPLKNCCKRAHYFSLPFSH